MTDTFINRLMIVTITLASVFTWSSPGFHGVDASTAAGPIRFEVEADVAASEGVFVEEAIRFAEEAFETRFGPRTFELDVIVRSGQSSFGPETYGVYDPGSIQIFTGSAAWTSRLDIERLKGVVHEYAHAYLDPAPNPRQRSLWLEEGLSEFLAWSVLSDTGLIDHAAILAYHAGIIRVAPPGERLCEITASSLSGFDYPFVHLGASLAIGPTGLTAIADYRDAMTGGQRHPDAFERAFGQTETEFCARSTETLLALTPSASVPNDLLQGAAQEVTADVRFTSVPAVASPGDQLLIEAESSAFANCLLESPHAGQSGNQLPRPSMTDSDGDLFWLITVSTEFPAGPFPLAATCGGSPARATVQIQV